MDSDDRLIVRVIQRYRPEWQPPPDTGRTWIPTRCPFHNEDRASAAVSYQYDAFKCLACPAGGNAITLIAQQEGTTYRHASRLAETISLGSSRPVPAKPPRKPSRRVFGGEEATGP